MYKWLFLLAFSGFLYLVHGILAPFVAAFAVSYFLNPLVVFCQRHSYIKLPRAFWSFISIALLMTLIITFLVFAGPLVYQQIALLIQVIANSHINTSINIERISNFLDQIIPNSSATILHSVTSLSAEFASIISSVLQNILYSGFAIIQLLAFCLITPLLTFYILKDWYEIVATIDGLIPHRYRNDMVYLKTQLSKVLTGYLHGQTYVCLILAIYYGLAFHVIGLNSSFTLGIMTGFMNLIPYVGVIFMALTTMLIAVLQFHSLEILIIVLAIFVIGMSIEGNFLTPKIIGDKVGLHPAIVIFALFAGGYLAGLMGTFLAFPVAAVIGVLIRFASSKYKKGDFYLR